MMKGRLITSTALLMLISCEEPIELLAPTNLTYIKNAEKTVTLSWERNNDQEGGFTIERKTGNGNYTFLTSKPAKSTSHTDSSLTLYKSYTYRVKATGADDDSEWSNELLLSTWLNAPATLNLSREGVTSYSISWSDNSGCEDGYVIERRVGSGSYTFLAKKAADCTSHIDSGLTIDETYGYRVKATSPEGDSEYSYERTATLAYNIDPPRNLTFTKDNETSIRLDWEDRSENEEGFIIERKVGDADYMLLAEKPADSTSHIDANLTMSQTYVYRVKAISQYKNSE